MNQVNLLCFSIDTLRARIHDYAAKDYNTPGKAQAWHDLLEAARAYAAAYGAFQEHMDNLPEPGEPLPRTPKTDT